MTNEKKEQLIELMREAGISEDKIAELINESEAKAFSEKESEEQAAAEEIYETEASDSEYDAEDFISEVGVGDLIKLFSGIGGIAGGMIIGAIKGIEAAVDAMEEL